MGIARLVLVVLALVSLLAGPLSGQEEKSGASAGFAVAPIPGVIAAGTRIELLQTWDPEFGGEGPIAAPDGSVLFAHSDANRIMRLDQSGKLSTHVEGTNRATSLGFDSKGRLIAAGSKPPQVLVLLPQRSVLAEKYQGRPFLRPKHLVVDRKDGIYFTDLIPIENQDRGPGKAPKKSDLPGGSPKAGVYYLKPNGQLLKVTEEVPEPNGIMLSPDEKTLYVTNLPGEAVMALDVKPDGTLGRARNFGVMPSVGAPSRADGIAVDSAGRVFVGAIGGVHVFDAAGKYLGRIRMEDKANNLAFGGPDKRTLYVISRAAAYRIQTITQGYTGRAK